MREDRRARDGAVSILLLIIVAIALGIVGAVVKGLLYLLIIGVVVLLADLVLAGVRPPPQRQAPDQVRSGGRGRSLPGLTA